MGKALLKVALVGIGYLVVITSIKLSSLKSKMKDEPALSVKTPVVYIPMCFHFLKDRVIKF